MAIKITGVRSLQNKLQRMASDLSYDATRIQKEHPSCGELALAVFNLAVEIERMAEKCTDTTA